MCPVEKKSTNSIPLIFAIVSVLLVGILLGLKAYGILGEKSSIESECESDSDCVASDCCHSSSCVPISRAPDCRTSFCTMDCREGTLDCGYAECACINSKCSMREIQ